MTAGATGKKEFNHLQTWSSFYFLGGRGRGNILLPHRDL